MSNYPSSFSTERFVDVAHGFCLHARACHAGKVVLRLRAAGKSPEGRERTLAWLTAVSQSPRLPAPREHAWNPLLQALLDDAGPFTIRTPGSPQPITYRLPDTPDTPYKILDGQPPLPEGEPGFTYASTLDMPPNLARRLAFHIFSHLPVDGGAEYVLDLPPITGKSPDVTRLKPNDHLGGALHRATLGTPHGPLEFGVFDHYANFTLNAGGRLRPIPMPHIIPAYVISAAGEPPRTPPTYYCRVYAPPRSPLAERYWNDVGPHDLDLALTRQFKHLAKKAIYGYFADHPGILPTYEQWREARSLDIHYPEPPPIANRWRAPDAESAADQRPAPPTHDASPRHNAAAIDPANTLLVPSFGTLQAHILQQVVDALPGTDAFACANNAIAAYSWYRDLPSVTRVEAYAHTENGERIELTALDTESDDFADELIVRRATRIQAALTIHDPRGGTRRGKALTCNLTCVPALAPSIYPRGYLFVTPDCDLDIEALRDLVVQAGFKPIFDDGLDTPDTQHEYHAYEALHAISLALESTADSHKRLITHLVKTQVVPQLGVKLPTTVRIDPDGVTVTVDADTPPAGAA